MSGFIFLVTSDFPGEDTRCLQPIVYDSYHRPFEDRDFRSLDLDHVDCRLRSGIFLDGLDIWDIFVTWKILGLSRCLEC